MRTIDEILDKIIELEGLRNDAGLAKSLKVKPNTVSTWRKRKTVPYDILFQYCEDRKYDVGWLITGEVTTRYVDVEGRKIAVSSREDSAERRGAQSDTFLAEREKQAPGGPGYPVPEEIRPIFDAFMEIMTSGHEGVKLALTQNIYMFLGAVRNAQKVTKLEKDVEEIKRVIGPREDDFKTSGSKGEKKQRAGGQN